MLDTAIILAGGQGTRLRPLTDNLPKPMILINGKPLLAHLVRSLERYGVKEIVISTGYMSDTITEYFEKNAGSFSSRISFSREEKPLGTGGAIKRAMLPLADKPAVLVLNADTLYSFDINAMYELHRKEHALVTIGTFSMDDVSSWGYVRTNGVYVMSFVEKPKTPTPVAGTINAGMYIISREAVGKMPSEETFSLERDFLAKIAGTGRLCFYAISEFYTVNTMQQYNDMVAKLAASEEHR